MGLTPMSSQLQRKKISRDHVIVSSGSYQAGRVEGGGSGTRDELGALHSAPREQAPPAKRWGKPATATSSLQLLKGEHLLAEVAEDTRRQKGV